MAMLLSFCSWMNVLFVLKKKENLLDFAVTTSNIWTLWTDKNGETMAYFTPIEK